VPSGRKKQTVEQAAANLRGEEADYMTSAGILDAAISRVSMARNDIAAAKAP